VPIGAVIAPFVLNNIFFYENNSPPAPAPAPTLAFPASNKSVSAGNFTELHRSDDFMSRMIWRAMSGDLGLDAASSRVPSGFLAARFKA